MVNGQWSMVNGQWSMVNGQWSMVNGQCVFGDAISSIIFTIHHSRLTISPHDWIANIAEMPQAGPLSLFPPEK
jgi:hypothetical protein